MFVLVRQEGYYTDAGDASSDWNAYSGEVVGPFETVADANHWAAEHDDRLYWLRELIKP